MQCLCVYLYMSKSKREEQQSASAESRDDVPSLEDYKSKDRQALDITEYKPKEPSDKED
jgi:hypothetical protein